MPMDEPLEIVLDVRGSETVDNVIDLRQLSVIGDRYIVDDLHEAQVVGPDHALVPGLIDLEVDQLVELGDEPVEARQWCEVTAGAAWIVLFEQGAEQTKENVLGIVRLTGPAGSQRMLEDLAVLLERPVEGLDDEIARRCGLTRLHPFLDATSLDLTPRGAQNKDMRLGNFFRLLVVCFVAMVRSGRLDGLQASTALIHPRALKHFAPAGIPYFDCGFGVLKYKLSETNTTPMETQLGVSVTEALIESLDDPNAMVPAAAKEVLRRSGITQPAPIPVG